MIKILTILTLSFLLSLNFVHAQELIENGTFDDSTGIWLLEEYGGGDFTWNIIDGVGRIIIRVIISGIYNLSRR